MKYVIVFAIILGSISTGWSHSADMTPIAKRYIDKYKGIAVQEMRRTGIPASVKLAQGLLESDWGRSNLARKANNHFGIKCGGAWTGGEFYKEDDDRNKEGKLIESCFRVFKDDTHSYKAHSDFLRDPKKEYRYGFLFDLPSSDYKAWAKGLLKAGYATDRQYPNKIISVVEKYRLYEFDQLVLDENGQLASEEKIPEAQAIVSYNDKERHFNSVESESIEFKISAVNRVPMTVVNSKMTLIEVAQSVGLSIDMLIQYNDGYEQPNSTIEPGSIIYLQKKKRSYVGTIDEHVILEGETLESIAQLYGIRVLNLRSKNKIPKDGIPVVGEVLQLREGVSSKNRPRFTRKNGRVPQSFLDNMETKGDFKNVSAESNEQKVEAKSKRRKKAKKSSSARYSID